MDWSEAKQGMLAALLEQPRIGLVTDMDGTLSPIVEDPAAARPTAQALAHLRALSDRLALVAVVSGRSSADLHARVALPGVVLAGNHGLEHWTDDGPVLAPGVAEHRERIVAALAAIALLDLPAGVALEDKGATLSIHYRRTADPAAASAVLRPAMARITRTRGLRLYEGRMVFEIRPPIDVNKGTALRALVVAHALDGAVFLGDDTTDVDALRMARDLRETGVCYALGIGVVAEGTPDAVIATADLLAQGVAGVESFLSWLASEVRASSS
jgi:trehalose 6-phosphate phosphatase